MPTVRSLVETLDTFNIHQSFAQAMDVFGSDLEQAWESTPQGDELLWLAAALGLEVRTLVSIACSLLEQTSHQIQTTGDEVNHVIETVHSWQQGLSSSEQVNFASYHAYTIVALMSDSRRASSIEEYRLLDAAVYLGDAITYSDHDFHLNSSPMYTQEYCHAQYANRLGFALKHLSHALALLQTGVQSGEQWPSSIHLAASLRFLAQFASFIRQQLPFALIKQAAQRHGFYSTDLS